jgi:broad specificity phosphatase PhoE
VSVPRAAERVGPRPDEQAEGASEAKPPAPTVVLLVRHGTTTTTGKELPGRAPGLHLAESGVRQASQVAARILAAAAPRNASGNGNSSGDGGGEAEHPGTKATPEGDPASPQGQGVAAIYASPLERAQETAAPIAEATGLPVQVEEGLVELDVGDWTGLALAEAAKRPEWKTIQAYPSGFTFPGGESFLAMQARMVATLDGLRARHPGQTVVAVSHADPIRAAVAHAMGTHLDHFQRIVVSPGSLTAIAFGHLGPIVLTVNATGDPGPLVPS